MDSQKGGGRRRADTRRWFELEPPAPERLELETSPRVATVASYVFTRAAERSWQVLNQHLEEPHGSVFWIGGPAGCGKTHFLDYVIALQRRAGALDAQNMRRLVCGLELAGRVRAAELELYLLSVLAEQIGGDPRSSGDLFRQMRGPAALNVGLETARRTGIKSITVAIDFGIAECEAAEFFAMLAQVAASFQQVKFTVIAAGRAMAPQATRPLAVAPADANEETIVAVRRARRLVEDADAGVAYAGIDTAGMPPDAIFPFHPIALSALRAIAAQPRPDGGAPDGVAIVSLSHLAREVLASPAVTNGSRPRLIYPPALTMNAAVLNLVKALLAEAGRAAWKIARDRIADLDTNDKDLAREIIDALIIEKVCGRIEPLAIEDLKSRVPTVAHNGSADAATTPAMRELLRQLELSTGGVIRFETDAARFDPEAAGAPELAAFRSAACTGRQSRRARRAYHAAGRRDGARGRGGSPHARGARSGAGRSQSRDAGIEQRDARRIYRAGRIGCGRDARGGRRSHLSRVGDSNHRRVRGAGHRRRFHSAVARDARVLDRDWAARRAGRTRCPRKPRAACGRRLVGDRMRAAASRARAASAGRAAAQSRRPRGALPEIQMDLRPMLPERARAMAREDGPP